MRSPLDYYLDQCKQGVIYQDQQQWVALQQLQETYKALCQEHLKRSKLLSAMRKPRLIHGNYLWGGVGIGKTFIMDCFFQCIPFPNKMRMHFHQFMRLVHQEMKRYQGTKDPLQKIAKDLSKMAILLCFDELTISDVADAMILGRLFEKLFAEGVCLVLTSNLSPDELYKNGLQRQHFLPAIALLKKKLKVYHLVSDHDYRFRHLKQAGVFYIPNDDRAHEKMQKTFNLLAGNNSITEDDVDVLGRKIPIRHQAGDVIWFNFKVICGLPRSQQDYLSIAEKYKTVFISDITHIHAMEKNRVILFIRLIDVLYDAGVRLLLSASTDIENIYNEGPMLFDYARACSRLHEMQSESYFLRGLETLKD